MRETLRRARRSARLSQLALSLELNVSQRHVSFVESGRARPSRELLHAWLEFLHVPLSERNSAMQAAGYAPVYSAARLDDAELAAAASAMDRLLRTHDPMPAFVIDAEWNVLNANRGARWLVQTLAPEVRQEAAPLNMLALLVAPGGLLGSIVNLREVGPPMLSHLRAECAAVPALAPKVAALASLLQERTGAVPDRGRDAGRRAPVLTTRFASPYGVLSFFTMLTTFGTPQDITLASLRVEHMFAADAATTALIDAHLGVGT